MQENLKLNVKLKLNVNVKIEAFKNGVKFFEEEKHNLTMTAGKNLIRDLLSGDVTTGLTYFAVGTDNTTPALTDTTLGTEVFRDTITQFTDNSASLNVKYYLSSTDANGNTLNEAGIYGNDATATVDSGVLFAHVTHSDIEKNSNISVTYSWDINFN